MLQQRDERIASHLYLRTKYQELREQFMTWRLRYYPIECAWCKKRLRWKRKEVSAPGDTSHGICSPCVTDLLSKMQAMKHAPAFIVTLSTAWKPFSEVWLV